LPEHELAATPLFAASAVRRHAEITRRNLLMVEDSPVSGETVHLYNNGRELTLSKDARNIEATRTIDAAGRVTLVEYSANPDLDVAFTYGSSAANDEIGRLIGITRHGATIDYEYDEFGRTTRDGGLVFGYDDHPEGDSKGGRA
jgi:hypothetical protein